MEAAGRDARAVEELPEEIRGVCICMPRGGGHHARVEPNEYEDQVWGEDIGEGGEM